MATILFWILVAAIALVLVIGAVSMGALYLMWESHDDQQALEEEYGETF